MITGLQLIEKDICGQICDLLDKVGLHYRIFSRSKEIKSIEEKIERKKNEGSPYENDGKKMQDIIGIRIVTYFQDDIYIVKDILSEKFEYVGEEIDTHELTVFKPKRTNIICKFDKKNDERFQETLTSYNNDNLKFADNTFELQLRTILSEGWHEIDHSLRYKCKDEWKNHNEKERMLNGIYANLEVNDIALKSLFNELAYQHFKSKNWEAMLRHKFRIKFQLVKLKPEIVEILNSDVDLAKQILKFDREIIIQKLAKLDFSIPINFNNLIYLINIFEFNNFKINEITPDIIKNGI
jgi:ppGpp synthetase/RelA/SpoT-type nucleotidyltranferase